MFKRFFVTILLVSFIISQSFAKFCSITTYNGGLTCLAVQASLSMAIMQAEEYFKNQRKQKINNPTQNLADDVDGYDKVTGYILTFGNSILKLRQVILYYQSKLAFNMNKKKNLVAIETDAKKLIINTGLLKAELNEALLKKSTNE